jgi:YbbR domain-containing protein
MKELKNWLLKNIDIKLLSLLLAFVLWLYVANGENPIIEKFIDVSLKASNLNESLVVNNIPKSISIGIKGQKNTIDNISPYQIEGIIDFSNIEKPGIYNLKVKTIAPKGIEIIRIIPSEIRAEVGKVLTQEVEVKYSLIGTPEKGYSLTDEPRFIPSKVKLIGAQSILENVKQVICSIDISGIKENLNKKIKVKAIDANGEEIKGVKIEPGIVEASISLNKGYPEKLLEVKPRIIGKPAPGYYISQILVEPDKIKIFGNYYKISNLDFLETIPIDVNGITKTLSVKVPPALEEGLNISNGEEQLIEVNIQVRESIIQNTLKNILVIPENLSPFVSYKIKPKVVDIIVEGKNILIDELKVEDIKAFVKFADDFKTEEKVKVQIELPEGISLIKVEPEEVTVLINK